MPAASEDIMRLDVVSPKTTVLPASPGRPFQMRMFTPLKGEVGPVAPIWYAYRVTASTRQPGFVVTTKSSASRNAPPVPVPCAARPPSALQEPPEPCNSLHCVPAGAATPLPVSAPVARAGVEGLLPALL